jgi:hypothetical protein
MDSPELSIGRGRWYMLPAPRHYVERGERRLRSSLSDLLEICSSLDQALAMLLNRP